MDTWPKIEVLPQAVQVRPVYSPEKWFSEVPKAIAKEIRECYVAKQKHEHEREIRGVLHAHSERKRQEQEHLDDMTKPVPETLDEIQHRHRFEKTALRNTFVRDFAMRSYDAFELLANYFIPKLESELVRLMRLDEDDQKLLGIPIPRSFAPQVIAAELARIDVLLKQIAEARRALKLKLATRFPIETYYWPSSCHIVDEAILFFGQAVKGGAK